MDTPPITYLSAQEVKDTTLLSGLKTLTPIDLESLIAASEDLIDAYVGKQKHHVYDSNINRVFPRTQDYQILGTSLGPIEYPQIPVIPYDVQKACLRQVEWLFVQWWTLRDTEAMPVQYDTSEVNVGGDGSISEKLVRGGLDLSAATLAPQARTILAQYRSRAAQIGLSRPGGLLRTAALSSREGSYLPPVQ